MVLFIGDMRIADKVTIASNFITRLKGLLGQKNMLPGSALLFRSCSAVHTLFMKFNIDVLFLDSKNQVVKIVENIRPFRFAIAVKATHTVELPAGTIKEHNIKVGDFLCLK